MNKNSLWACLITNSICTICWVTLAVIFDRWWIALFGLLFVSSFIIKERYYRICDKCGKHSPYANNYNEALDKAKKAGWVHYVDGNKDYCPDCRES